MAKIHDTKPTISLQWALEMNVFLKPTLSLLVVPEIIFKRTYSDAADDKIGFMTTLCFQWVNVLGTYTKIQAGTRASAEPGYMITVNMRDRHRINE